MRAFIVRPFGTRKTGGTEPVLIDFERVERELIAPALAHFQIHGLTTMEIAAQHNIRVDMFERLVTADIVLADISIHNANVFYELGIRHALRDRHTFLLRCKGDDVPFDLRTDRYFEYSSTDPAATLPALIEALAQTLRASRKDSPVFQLLPDLEGEEPEKFMILPKSFAESVDRADAAGLELFSDEIAGLVWESRGLRMIGRAQFSRGTWEGARATWESLLNLHPQDPEVNLRLGTVYQRLAEAAENPVERSELAALSDQMLLRVLEFRNMPPHQRARSQALLGRNQKVRWHDSWAALPPEKRRATALESPNLEAAHQYYARGFVEDCNHFYAGLNALALIACQIELAEAMPDLWIDLTGGEASAAGELNRRRVERSRLEAAVSWSLHAASERETDDADDSFWRGVSEADLLLFTAKHAGSVRAAYRRSLDRASILDLDAVDRQLRLYEQIGVLSDNCVAARQIVDERRARILVASAKPETPPARVLLFSGHNLDLPGRDEPRFPPAMEGVARDAIRATVQAEIELAAGAVLGIAGAAHGADIIFHEVCRELEVTTRVYLAIPRDEYQVESVQDAGDDWVERFRTICDRSPPFVMQATKTMPDWLQDKPEYTVWQRNNLWILHQALTVAGGSYVTLIALWDGEGRGDGPGGTADMVRIARSRGAKLRHIDSRRIFGL
jgi:hypothetical protein